MSDNEVQVLNILGQTYSIRANEHEQQLLERAGLLLQKRLAENELLYPKARSLELMVLTALNLCVPLTQHDEQMLSLQQRLDALIERSSQQLNDPQP